MAVVRNRRFRRLVQIAQSSLRTVDPVAILDLGRLQHAVRLPQHLQELTRGFPFVRRRVMTKNQDRIGQRDRDAGLEGAGRRHFDLRRRRQQIPKLGPDTADGAIRLGPDGTIIVVHRRQVLEIEHVAERRFLDAEIQHATIQPPLAGFDDAVRAQRIVVRIDRIQVAWHEWHGHGCGRRKGDGYAQMFERASLGTNNDQIFAQRTANFQSASLARLHGGLGAREIPDQAGGAQRDPATTLAPNE